MPTSQEYYNFNTSQILGGEERGVGTSYIRFNTNDAHSVANVLVYPGLQLPAVPVVHPYNPVEPEGAAFNFAVPMFFLVARVYGENQNLLARFPGVQEIEQYVVVQSNSWRAGHELLFRPHPWLNPNVPNQPGTSASFNTNVALGFPADMQAQTFVTHDQVYSPNNAPVTHFVNPQDSSHFYTLCVFGNRAALTLHILVHPTTSAQLVRFLQANHARIKNLNQYLDSLAIFNTRFGSEGFASAVQEIHNACYGNIPGQAPLPLVGVDRVVVPVRTQPPVASSNTTVVTAPIQRAAPILLLKTAQENRRDAARHYACVQMFCNMHDRNHHNIVLQVLAKDLNNLEYVQMQAIIQAAVDVLQDQNPNANAIRARLLAANPQLTTAIHNPELIEPQSALRQAILSSAFNSARDSQYSYLQDLILNAFSVSLGGPRIRPTLGW